MICLFFVLTAIGTNALYASQTDGGRLVYRGEGPDGPHLYISTDLDAIDKIHFVSGIPDCRCVASADAQKINLIDYLYYATHLYSYAFYVNTGQLQARRSCNLSSAQIGARTDLKVNLLGVTGSGQSDDDSATADRIEGLVFYRGMRDFYANKYTQSNWEEISSTDKSGGVLYVHGNVELRPCRLFPWYAPWIYNDGTTRHRVDLATSPHGLSYMSPDDMSLFDDILKTMRDSGAFRSKHDANIEDNEDSGGKISVFTFHAVFIPHRYAREFAEMLAYFAETTLSPYLYVPFVMQAVFDKNEWLYFTREHTNETIRVATAPLLTTCAGETVATMEINPDAAGSLYWFAYEACGGGVLVVIEHAIEFIEIYSGESIYSILFYLLIALLALLSLCYYRRGITRCIAISLSRRRRGAIRLPDTDDPDITGVSVGNQARSSGSRISKNSDAHPDDEEEEEMIHLGV